MNTYSIFSCCSQCQSSSGNATTCHALLSKCLSQIRFSILSFIVFCYRLHLNACSSQTSWFFQMKQLKYYTFGLSSVAAVSAMAYASYNCFWTPESVANTSSNDVLSLASNTLLLFLLPLYHGYSLYSSITEVATLWHELG
jgi:hypothetical protein